MTNKIYLVLALCLVTFSIKIHHLESAHAQIPGGWSPINIKNLSKEEKDVDTFIRASEPEYKNAVLLSGSKQVVAGMNYKYIYEVDN